MIKCNSRVLFRSVIQLCLLIAFNSTVFANSSSYYDKDGASVFPLETNNIVMQKEVVRIKPTKDGWRATCEFTFYNKTEAIEPVTMGYPDWLNENFDASGIKAFWKYFKTLPAEKRKAYGEPPFATGYGYDQVYFKGYKEGKLPYIAKAWNLHDLAVALDGEKVNIKHKAVVERKDLPGDGAYIWKVSFAPHETKLVKVTFSFNGLNDIDGYQKAIYILQTGALWADKIGMADIYWDIKDQDVKIKQIVPQDFKVEGSIIHWHFENFKPTEDIVVYAGEYLGSEAEYATDTITDIYRTKARYDGNARYYSEYDVSDMHLDKQLHQLYVKALRNEIYARNGRPFKSDELNRIFSRCGWYAPKDDYGDNVLNEYEKKNLKFIADYEKKKGWR